MKRVLAAAAILAVGLSACDEQAPLPTEEGADEKGFTSPTAETLKAQQEIIAPLDLNNQTDFDLATRGLLVSANDMVIKDADGKILFDRRRYDFVEGDAPQSVNPSLWRQAKLNNIAGLFEVVPGIYQVRGIDLANMSVIVGETGYIVVDPLTTAETAAVALKMVRDHLGDKPVTAVIFTHSHIDHFGGAAGVLTDEQIEAGEIPIIAPAGFFEEATSENILAGIAMGRRASYMYGMLLPYGPRGHIGAGLGKEAVRGAFGLVPPNDIIDQTGQERVLDGVRFQFQFTPESEAPAELTFYLPELKAFCGAEIVSHTMHNLYTLRGAKVRDALRWLGYIDEAIDLFGDAEVIFASHHWPIWGNAEMIDYLKKQRDTYKFIHDQTLRFANKGLNATEIANEIELPPTLAASFGNRGYYGTVSHNAKAVYQHYFGWFDGNPANLDKLPQVEAADRYVDFMGGADEVVAKAQVSFDEGDYRWVAEVLNHVVMADPDHVEAKTLLAKAYDQLGYQAESGPWRSFYLTGALELRHGNQNPDAVIKAAGGIVERIPTHLFFDAMATMIDAEAAGDTVLNLNFVFTDIDEVHLINVENAVLHHRRIDKPREDADATLILTRKIWEGILGGGISPTDLLGADGISVEGSQLKLLSFLRLIDLPGADAFNIVTP